MKPARRFWLGMSLVVVVIGLLFAWVPERSKVHVHASPSSEAPDSELALQNSTDLTELLTLLRREAARDIVAVPIPAGEELRVADYDLSDGIVVFRVGPTDCGVIVIDGDRFHRLHSILLAHEASVAADYCGTRLPLRDPHLTLRPGGNADVWAILYPRGGHGLLYWFELTANANAPLKQQMPSEARLYEDADTHQPTRQGWCLQAFNKDVDGDARIDLICGSSSLLTLRSPLLLPR